MNRPDTFKTSPASVDNMLATIRKHISRIDLPAIVPTIYRQDFDVWEWVERDDCKDALHDIREASAVLDRLRDRITAHLIEELED